MSQEVERFESLAEWLAYCEQLHSKTIDMGLERVMQVKEALDIAFNCPVITVAGTNGKGSTCAMLESILNAAGESVGVFTSPHLIHFEERCRINQKIASANALIRSFERVEAARHQVTVSLSYFEFTTLVILDYLSRQELDFVILEVGLGGRLDAVNVIDADYALITNIGIDHVEFLGDSREKIGYEKAGIMRPNAPVVVNDPEPPQSVIDYAEQIGAKLIAYDVGYRYKLAEQGASRADWNWQGRNIEHQSLPPPALFGENQYANAAGVLALLEAVQEDGTLTLSEEAIRQGLTTVSLPGRFQLLQSKPALVLDVGHNPHAMKALVHNLEAMGQYAKTWAVFGAMHDKDLKGVVELIAPYIDEWCFSDLPLPRAARATELKEVVAKHHAELQMDEKRTAAVKKADCFTSPWEATAYALQSASAADRIIVFGSFFTVSGVLEHWTFAEAPK